ncbi:cysteine desulfurase-like protein [Zunongwangia sp.]|uniref:cysteine desulfurase-like protein n=1 Tax=Zunongwangia sp. TaxID=1965325 RepID=UPI003AA80C9A
MDIEYIRKQFPALSKDFVFMDNAGGSQALGKVIERISGYLVHHNVQLGASYKISKEANEKQQYTLKQLAKFINANRSEEVVIGPSASMLLKILSISLSQNWKKGDEVIVTNTDHEANVSPWTALQERGITVKIWKVNPENFQLEIDDLKKLLSDKTKLVAVTHCSNILGSINDIPKIANVVHNHNALICVDGVAYAPHRQIDVQKWNVDFYTFSWYKTFGPHLGIMYGKYDLLHEMEGINHYFFSKDDIPYKFQPGNYNFELTYSLLGIVEYYLDLFQHHFTDKQASFQDKLKKSYQLIANQEEALSTELLSYLSTNPKIKIIGSNEADANKRVPTISFVHEDLTSDEIVKFVDDYRIGIRFGDFYAKKIIEDLELTPKNGVVRISLVHYNTVAEVKRLVKVFKEIL